MSALRARRKAARHATGNDSGRQGSQAAVQMWSRTSGTRRRYSRLYTPPLTGCEEKARGGEVVSHRVIGSGWEKVVSRAADGNARRASPASKAEWQTGNGRRGRRTQIPAPLQFVSTWSSEVQSSARLLRRSLPFDNKDLLDYIKPTLKGNAMPTDFHGAIINVLRRRIVSFCLSKGLQSNPGMRFQ